MIQLMQNPIGEADLEWILHRNCEGTEQLRIIKETKNRGDMICLKKLMKNAGFVRESAG